MAAASVLTAVAETVTEQTSGGKLVRAMCSLALLATLAAVLAGADPVNLRNLNADSPEWNAAVIEETVAELTCTQTQAALEEKLTSDLQALGLNCRIQVETQLTDGVALPVSARIAGADAGETAAAYVQRVLGIADVTVG